MSETKVGHCKKDSTDVYAGRGPNNSHMNNTEPYTRGWLGNPYRKEEYGRSGCIDRFTADFVDKLKGDPEFRAAVRELSGKTLGCWCQEVGESKPACHAEVIAEHADRLAGDSDE